MEFPLSWSIQSSRRNFGTDSRYPSGRPWLELTSRLFGTGVLGRIEPSLDGRFSRSSMGRLRTRTIYFRSFYGLLVQSRDTLVGRRRSAIKNFLGPVRDFYFTGPRLFHPDHDFYLIGPRSAPVRVFKIFLVRGLLRSAFSKKSVVRTDFSVHGSRVRWSSLI